jgi:hypothetical protein
MRFAIYEKFRYSLLTAFILLLTFITANAQTPYIKFVYDNSGNNISRTVVFQSPPPPAPPPAPPVPPQDSTDNGPGNQGGYITETGGNYTGGTTWNEPIITETITNPNETEKIEELGEEGKAGSFTSSQALESEPEYIEHLPVYTDIISETVINIYPNPTKGHLAIKVSNLPQNSVSGLILSDVNGRIIEQKQSLSEHNELDISEQPSGVYIMNIVIDSKSVVWRIIKQ